MRIGSFSQTFLPTESVSEKRLNQRQTLFEPQTTTYRENSKLGDLQLYGLYRSSLLGKPKGKLLQDETIQNNGKDIVAVYRVGEPTRPPMQFDNGFLQNPNDANDPTPLPVIEPTKTDREFHEKQLSNVRIAKVLLSMGFNEKSTLPDWIPKEYKDSFEQNKHFLASPDGIEAYERFLSGSGRSGQFDFEKFIKEDVNGQVAFSNIILDTQKGVESIYQQMIEKNPALAKEEIRFSVTGSNITVGDSSKDIPLHIRKMFPYPSTSNWQKALGGFQMWTSGEVVVSPPTSAGQPPIFTMKLNARIEDRYNFNPKNKDIETGTPDAVNGRLEVVGLAKQYQNYASGSRLVAWQKGRIANTNVSPFTEEPSREQ